MSRAAALVPGLIWIAAINPGALTSYDPGPLLPDFTRDYTCDTARALLKRYDLEGQCTPGASARPAGLIYEQDPAAGTPISKIHAAVTLRVSSGPQAPAAAAAVLPDFTHGRCEEARQALGELKLKANCAAGQAGGPAGEIYQQDPAAGTPIAQVDGPVTLYLWSNPPPAQPANATGPIDETVAPRPQPAQVWVPDLYRLPLKQALTVLTASSLEPAQTRSQHDWAPRDVVIAQQPRAGASVRAGSAVALTISAGVDLPFIAGWIRSSASGRGGLLIMLVGALSVLAAGAVVARSVLRPKLEAQVEVKLEVGAAGAAIAHVPVTGPQVRLQVHLQAGGGALAGPLPIIRTETLHE